MSDTYASRSMHACFCCCLSFSFLALPYRHASSLFEVYTCVKSFCDISWKKDSPSHRVRGALVYLLVKAHWKRRVQKISAERSSIFQRKRQGRKHLKRIQRPRPSPSAGVGVGTTTRTGTRDARSRVSTKDAGQPPHVGGRMGEGSNEGDHWKWGEPLRNCIHVFCGTKLLRCTV